MWRKLRRAIRAAKCRALPQKNGRSRRLCGIPTNVPRNNRARPGKSHWKIKFHFERGRCWPLLRAILSIEKGGCTRRNTTAIAFSPKKKVRVSLLSRNAIDRSARYSRIADAVRALPAQTLLLDGEEVAFDKKGVSRFQLVQQGNEDVMYAVFDCLYINGKDLRREPLSVRCAALEESLHGASGAAWLESGIKKRPCSGDCGRLHRASYRKLTLRAAHSSWR